MADPYNLQTGIMRDPLEVVPYVGMTGYLSLAAPYTALCSPGVQYTVTSVATIAGAIAQGQDPLTDIYLANGDIEASFLVDEAKNHCLITVQSGLGNVVMLPNSALITLPVADGELYCGIMLGISLSALPVKTDLTAIKADISDLVFNRLGVRSTVYPAVTSSQTIVPFATHTAIEAARLVNITSFLSTVTENTNLKAQNTALLAKLALLEAYIASTL